MDRRGFIQRVTAALGVAVAGRAVADQGDARIGSFSELQDPEDKYWQAQSHIDLLYDEMDPPIMMGDTVEIYDLFSDEMRELKITTAETLKLARQQGWKKV